MLEVGPEDVPKARRRARGDRGTQEKGHYSLVRLGGMGMGFEGGMEKRWDWGKVERGEA